MNATAEVITFPGSEPAAGQAVWDSEVDAFVLACRAKRLSPNTITGYQAALRSFALSQIARGRSLDPERITAQDIQLYMVEQQEANLKGSTQLTRYATLRAFFRHLVAEDVIEHSPMLRTSPPKFKYTPPPVVTKSDLTSLLASVSGRSFMDRRDNAIIRLMLSTGIRRSEVVGIALDDIDVQQHKLTIYGKGETQRDVTFGYDTALALTRYLRERAKHPRADRLVMLGRSDIAREGKPLFLADYRTAGGGHAKIASGVGITHIGVHAMLKRRCRAAGIDALHLHQFRHTWTDGMLSTGHSEIDVQTLGGWTNGKMLARYGAAQRSERARRNYRDPMDTILKTEGIDR